MTIKKYYFPYAPDGELVMSYLVDRVNQSTPPQSVSVGPDGIQVEIDDSAFDEMREELENKFDVEYFGEITGNSYAGKGDYADIPTASELPDGTNYFAEDVNQTYTVSNGEWTREEATDWVLNTDMFEIPAISYFERDVGVNETGQLAPVILSGTTPITSWDTIGTLPSEFTFDSDTGIIDYDTTGSVADSGTFQVTATNPKGTSEPYDFDWSISSGNGVAQYTNSEIVYPAMRLTPSGYSTDYIFIKQAFHGTTTGYFDGTIIEDSSSPIYVAQNSGGNFDYMIMIPGSGYWALLQNRTTNPATLVNGLATDLDYTFDGTSYLVCPTTDDFTVASVNYPSDQSDVHYLTTASYLSAGTDSSFDGFGADDTSWSYGFTLVDAIPDDGLGRAMFGRFLRNWTAFYIGHNSTYTNIVYGNGSNRSYTGETSYPSGGFSAGTKIHVTYDGSELRLLADGVEIFSANPSAFWDSESAANSLELVFGVTLESDTAQAFEPYYHGLWQGKISDLWLSATTVEDGSLGIPAGATHSWSLSETTGKTFAASKGGIPLTGKVLNG